MDCWNRHHKRICRRKLWKLSSFKLLVPFIRNIPGLGWHLQLLQWWCWRVLHGIDRRRMWSKRNTHFLIFRSHHCGWMDCWNRHHKRICRRKLWNLSGFELLVPFIRNITRLGWHLQLLQWWFWRVLRAIDVLQHCSVYASTTSNSITQKKYVYSLHLLACSVSNKADKVILSFLSHENATRRAQ